MNAVGVEFGENWVFSKKRIHSRGWTGLASVYPGDKGHLSLSLSPSLQGLALWSRRQCQGSRRGQHGRLALCPAPAVGCG
jgi:hypothetical protein